MREVGEILNELDAGVFAGKVSRALADTALAVTEHGREGKVVLELKLKRIGESNQVAIAHTVKYDRPTMRGKITEQDTTETPMHVGPRGRLTMFPENQIDAFNKKEKAND